jgi:hypothetical protein
VSRYSGPGDYSGGTTPRAKVRERKRREAIERNAKTPDVRRRAWREPIERRTAALR